MIADIDESRLNHRVAETNRVNEMKVPMIVNVMAHEIDVMSDDEMSPTEDDATVLNTRDEEMKTTAGKIGKIRKSTMKKSTTGESQIMSKKIQMRRQSKRKSQISDSLERSLNKRILLRALK